MEALFENPGLVPLLENVLGNLDWKTFLQCRLVSKSVKNVIDNPHYSVKKMFRDGRKMNRDIADDVTKIKALLNKFPRIKVKTRVWSHFNFPIYYQIFFKLFGDSSVLATSMNQEREWLFASQNPDKLNYSFDKSITLYVMKKYRYLSEYQLFQSANGLDRVQLDLQILCETKTWKNSNFLSKTLGTFSIFIMIIVGITFQDLKFYLPTSRNCFHCQKGTNQEIMQCKGCETLKFGQYSNLSHLYDLCIIHRLEQVIKISKSKEPMRNIIEVLRQNSVLKNSQIPLTDQLELLL